jgi:hypothetical protein
VVQLTVARFRLVPEGSTVRFVPEQRTVQSGAGPTLFHGKATALLGAGDDRLRLADDGRVTFCDTAVFDGQAGDNLATVEIANLPVLPKLRRFQVTQG